eukprot:TRINITY_DN33938_c0_g1_i1.p1 TRINITY_DN33938_c0_g1~~TRINITY_DN33938_c0_g1_i1.p1  ORF type:complete len:128 (+),score=14.66 TRINITY_DN33938_c0_g1_i1:507-890(+)
MWEGHLALIFSTIVLLVVAVILWHVAEHRNYQGDVLRVMIVVTTVHGMSLAAAVVHLTIFALNGVGYSQLYAASLALAVSMMVVFFTRLRDALIIIIITSIFEGAREDVVRRGAPICMQGMDNLAHL